MPAYKDSKTGTWFVKFYCKDWTGENKQIKNKIQQYDKFLNVKGLVEEFKEFVRPKSIKERMEDKQKRVETQKKQTVMKHVSRRKEDIAI